MSISLRGENVIGRRAVDYSEGVLVSGDEYTDCYWMCDCESENIMASWYEYFCESCGLKQSEGEAVLVLDVVMDLEREDGRLRGSLKKFFESANN
tara:strand:+ start:2989 stop:3273 length:285 start_codon:yes stop_codon:yes gene_type:complete